ncbi:MAG: PepSY domain-containing protein [Magnetococcales bacterium]|nr:PepSY domain-containing protein [Magnetococcales bacterium]MBF0322029.1 PepSY domain-containing protein [Magnetococcales bacterium]
MFFRGWRLPFLLPVLCMLHPVIGQTDDDHEDVRRLVQAGIILPLEKILKASQNFQRGRLLEVKLKRRHGGYIYELELVTQQGIVWELEFDATNGVLLEQEKEK